MGWNSVAGEVVVDSELIEFGVFQGLESCQLVKKMVEILWDMTLLLIFINLVPSIFEGISMMLDSPIVKSIPFAPINVLE